MKEEIEKVPTDIIDDPATPMRNSIDEEKLDELARSIKAHGLIQPITLRKVGERYEVIAGHRRLMAHKRAGIPLISAIVRDLSDEQTDSQRMHENLYRDDINPVDEARYIRAMIDKHETSPEELTKITGKSEAYLRSRYELLDYPTDLLLAVELGEIGLTAAQWLVKITNPQVLSEYTRFARLGGITAKRAEAWYRSWSVGSLPRDPESYVSDVIETNAEPIKLMMPCVLCRIEDDIENMGLEYVHKECKRAAAGL